MIKLFFKVPGWHFRTFPDLYIERPPTEEAGYLLLGLSTHGPMTWDQLHEFWKEEVGWHPTYLTRTAMRHCLDKNWIVWHKGCCHLTQSGAELVNPELHGVHKFEEVVIGGASKHFRERLCLVFARASQQASAIPPKKRGELSTLTIIPRVGVGVGHAFATDVIRRPSQCVDRFNTNRTHELPTHMVPVYSNDAELLKDLLRRNGAHIVSSYKDFENPNQVAVDPSFGFRDIPDESLGQKWALVKDSRAIRDRPLEEYVRVQCEEITGDGHQCTNLAKRAVEFESGVELCFCGVHARRWQ